MPPQEHQHHQQHRSYQSIVIKQGDDDDECDHSGNDNSSSSSTAVMEEFLVPVKGEYADSADAEVVSARPAVNFLHLFYIFATPALGGFLYGYDIGATSFVLSLMLKDDGVVVDDNTAHQQWWTVMTEVQQGLFVSMLSFGAFAGSHIIWQLSSVFDCSISRRTELRVASFLYVIGMFFMILSAVSEQTSSFAMAIFGRLMYGIAVGFVMHAAPAYMAEMCPTEYRGAMVSAKETVIVGGIVFGYGVGAWMASTVSEWYWIYMITYTMSIPMVMLAYRIPRSQRWLLQQNQVEEAKDSMQFVYRGNIDAVFENLVQNVRLASAASNTAGDMPKIGATANAAPGTRAAAALGSSNLSAYVASFGLILFQQCSGQPSVLSYATILLETTGWSGDFSVYTSIFMMCVSTITVALVDRVGRKFLLTACCIVMSTSLMVLSMCFWNASMGDNGSSASSHQHDDRNIVVLIAMFLYIGGYQLGFGPITWTIVSEIHTSSAIALNVQFNYVLNFLVQFMFPTLLNTFGWSNVFGLFATAMVICMVFIHYKVPETKGLSLEEIAMQQQQQNNISGAKSNKQHHHSNTANAEDTPLLPKQTPVLGALPNLEEMESTLQRTLSDPGFGPRNGFV